MRTKSIFLILATVILFSTFGFAQSTTSKLIDNNKNNDERMAWWHDAKFGMFIHWGLYAIPARGEWFMNKEKIPVAEYAKLATQFNPVKFNAEEWVRFAKDAGMKYIVITSKHHDGFAMYDSKVSSYNIVDASPFKRDPLKELSEACAKNGIRFGVYYSQAQDWHQPGGAVARGFWDSTQLGDFDHYLHTLAIPQVKELLIDYKPAVIWFDTPKDMTPDYAREFEQVVRSIHPETIINSRLLYSGGEIKNLDRTKLDELQAMGVDYLSYPDRGIPEQPAPSWGKNWETCMTLNNSWGYTATDNNWKTPQQAVQMLVRVVSKGGNFLLNFGPTAEGELPAESMKIMKQVGAWLRVNGEAIYNVNPCNLNETKKPITKVKDPVTGKLKKTEPDIDWLATSRPALKTQAAKIYLHIFKWPKAKFEVKGISSKVKKAYLLANPNSMLKFVQNNSTLELDLPTAAVDDIATVVCLEMKD